jgi:murein DD-endopeptidase MepM/ murein hydrolase activator NlpD
MALVAPVISLLPVEGIHAKAQATMPSRSARTAGLIPIYPSDRRCSPLTSLYSSWDDVDGTKRDEPHSGVDGGRLGEPILAPAGGTVVAAWRANWGWGAEGALLIRHSKEDLGLQDGPNQYYSEFDHLRYGEIRTFKPGQRVERGERLASVYRPGGKEHYLPEVHWEVWAIEDESATRWSTNRHGARRWTNKTAHLIDPVRMLALNAPPRNDGRAEIAVFDPARDYRDFRGFTYILPCPKRDESGEDAPTPR